MANNKIEYKKQATPSEIILNEVAVKIAVKIIRQFEGCNLVSYPDPCSQLYQALSTHGKLGQYLSGKLKWKDLPENFQALSGHPFTIGYGATGEHITKDTVWTEQEALQALETEARRVMATAIKNCPKLAEMAPERVAAITSFAYNIGDKAFKDSTACKRIMEGKNDQVGDAIKLFNKAGGKIVQGLVNRRQVEANMWNCVQ